MILAPGRIASVLGRLQRPGLVLWLGGATLLALLLWRFPPIRVVPFKAVQELRQAEAFDAARVAASFWTDKLLPATSVAAEASDVFEALTNDAAAARAQYGRTFGLSDVTLFWVQGGGRVTAIEDKAVIVSLDGTKAKVSLRTGMLFGDVVRDATGLLDANAYPNSQDFNALGAELNRIIETRVTPTLREQAASGKALRFAGCFELEEGAQPEIWPVIPVKIEWP